MVIKSVMRPHAWRGTNAFYSKNTLWKGTAEWPVAGGRRARRSLESTSTSDDGVDLLALKDELERKDAELLKLRAELSKLLLKVKELEAEHRVVLD